MVKSRELLSTSPVAAAAGVRAALAGVLDGFSDVVLLLDEQYRIVEANARAVHHFGFARAELTNRLLADLVPAAEWAAWRMFLEAGGHAAHGRRDLRALHRDGAIGSVLVGAGHVDLEGRRYTICSIAEARDFVAGSGANERTVARFRESQRIAKIGNWDWDLVNDLHWWSDELYRMLEIDPAKVQRPFHAFMERVHPDDRERATAESMRVRSGDHLASFDVRVLLPSGLQKVFRSDGITTRDECGRPVRAYGTFQDITGQKAIEAALSQSDFRYREAQKLAQIGSWEWDLATNKSWWSDELFRILEEDSSAYEASFENFLSKVHPDERALLTAGASVISADPAAYEPSEVRLLLDGGREKIIEVLVRTRLGADGRPVAVVGTVHDVTERRALERQLRESEARYASTVELAAVGIVNIDADGRFLWSNRRMCDMLGYSLEELRRLTIYDVSHPDDRNVSDRNRTRLFTGDTESENIEKRYLHKDGSVVWVRITSALRRNAEGEPLYDVSIVEDITARKKAEERVQYLATHDELTGLPNRASFGELVERALESARRHGRLCAVLFIDLDRFKIVNDSLGHQAGDLLLKEMAGRLRGCIGKRDVVARLGGDEFVVLLDQLTDASQASDLAKKLLSAVILPVGIKGHECRVTASIGIALHPTDAPDAAGLMKQADMAMYHAKEEGKNNYQFFSASTSPFSVERLVLEAHLARALEKDEFRVQYQPKVDLATGAVTGAEALLRWWNTELGAVSPAQFVPVAEDTGLIVSIGRWALKTACAQNMEWQRRGLPKIAVCVNLSPRQFKDVGLLSDIESVLEETGMDPELLELEITESMIMHNVDYAAEQASAIKSLGVKLAIDDFGTGFSSLSQLKRFPVDTLKIDRSFVRDVPENSQDMAIAEAIITLGKALGVSVVAEGVETEKQRAFLSSKGCDQVQGFYFGRPCHPDAFAELLQRGS